MLFDTDVLIWYLRGNHRAAQAINRADHRALSTITYMELLQGARNKAELQTIKSFLRDIAFDTVALSENIGHRASIYLEEYGLSGAMSMADALIAATAVEAHLPLCTANVKHYKPVKELRIKRFRPQ